MKYLSISKMLGVLSLAVYPATAQTSRVVVVNLGDATASIYAASHVIPGGDPALKLEKVLPVGKAPNEVCMSPNGKRAYVGNRGDISVTAIDMDNLAVASTITDPAMINPDGCAVTADGTKLYVAAAGAESVFVFSTADGHKLNQFKVGKEPRRLLFSADGTRLYVSNGEERFVSVIDTKTNAEVGQVKAGRDPRGMAFTSDGKYLAIGNVSDDTVQFVKIGSTEPEFVVGVPRSPQRVVVVPSKEILFTIGRVDNLVSLLDIRQNHEYGRLMTTLPVGRAPWGMALSAAGDCVYVTNTGDDTISVIDLRLMKAAVTIPTGKRPMGLAVR